MKREELEQYEDEERRWARSVGSAVAPQGFVEDIRPLFRDQTLPERHAVRRRGAPFHILLLLYPSTIIYVLPISAKALRTLVGMPLAQLVELVDCGIVRPIIGHPTDYAGLSHFDPILRRKLRVPSVWARGDEVAHSYADAAAHWEEARKVLPLEDLARLPAARNKWQRQFPFLRGEALTDRVKVEVCTNYVDLCIFGWQPLARRLADLSDHRWMFRRLLELNEVATYPHLIGAAGTVNYGLADASDVEAAKRELLIAGKVEVIGPEASLLTSGLNIRFPSEMTTDALVAFHEADMASRLWRALQLLERKVAEAEVGPSLVDASARAAVVFEEAERHATDIAFALDRRRLRKQVHHSVDAITKLGSTAGIGLAALSTHALSPIAAILAGIAASKYISDIDFVREELTRIDESITDRLLGRKFSSLATQLWWIHEWSRGRDNRPS